MKKVNKTELIAKQFVKAVEASFKQAHSEQLSENIKRGLKLRRERLAAITK